MPQGKDHRCRGEGVIGACRDALTWCAAICGDCNALLSFLYDHDLFHLSPYFGKGLNSVDVEESTILFCVVFFTNNLSPPFSALLKFFSETFLLQLPQRCFFFKYSAPVRPETHCGVFFLPVPTETYPNR